MIRRPLLALPLPLLLSLLVLPAAFAATPADGDAASPGLASATVDDLAFMTGSWAMAGPPLIEEQWTKPAGGTLIGMGRVSGNGKTFFFEFLRIETRPEGLFYVAQPKGGPKTDFKLVKLAPGEAVFENPEHDFPKRIIYRKLEGGRLFARTEGDGTEKEKPSEFTYEPQP